MNLKTYSNVYWSLKKYICGQFPTIKATGTITSDGINITADDTVTIDVKVYKFVASPTDEGDVDIGTNAAISLTNLYNAINHTGTPDVDYKCASAHPTVSGKSVTDTILTLEAIIGGIGGNSIALDEASTHLTKSATTLLGGFAIPVYYNSLSRLGNVDEKFLIINFREGRAGKMSYDFPRIFCVCKTDPELSTLTELTGSIEEKLTHLSSGKKYISFYDKATDKIIGLIKIDDVTIRPPLNYREGFVQQALDLVLKYQVEERHL